MSIPHQPANEPPVERLSPIAMNALGVLYEHSDGLCLRDIGTHLSTGSRGLKSALAEISRLRVLYVFLSHNQTLIYKLVTK
jgi:hypothetical protein